MKQKLTIGIMILMLCSGCAFLDLEYQLNKYFGPEDEETARQLALGGREEVERGKYKKALKKFDKLKDWYPFSRYALLAELKIADCNYKLGEYDKAIEAYEQFINLHPRNEAVPQAIYHIGLCYFEQIATVDRDQTSARKALDTFGQLKKHFPESEYTYKADEKIDECLKSLAGNEFYIGIFYYKSKHYKAAFHRFRNIVTNYPDVGIHKQALDYMTLAELSLKEAKN
jgi:outer membrane protein assembly factor BamD